MLPRIFSRALGLKDFLGLFRYSLLDSTRLFGTRLILDTRLLVLEYSRVHGEYQKIIQNVKNWGVFLEILPKNFVKIDGHHIPRWKTEQRPKQLHNAIEVYYYQMHKSKGKDYIIRHVWPSFGLYWPKLATFGYLCIVFGNYWQFLAIISHFWLFLYYF